MITTNVLTCSKKPYDVVKAVNSNNQFYWLDSSFNSLFYTDTLTKDLLPTLIWDIPFKLIDYKGMCVYYDNTISHLIFSVASTLYYMRINIQLQIFPSTPRMLGDGTYPRLFLRTSDAPSECLFQYAILHIDLSKNWRLLFTNNFLTFFFRTDLSQYNSCYTYENTNLTIEQYIRAQQNGAQHLDINKSYLGDQCA